MPKQALQLPRQVPLLEMFACCGESGLRCEVKALTDSDSMQGLRESTEPPLLPFLRVFYGCTARHDPTVSRDTRPQPCQINLLCEYA